jgi:hypothetical protein
MDRSELRLEALRLAVSHGGNPTSADRIVSEAELFYGFLHDPEDSLLSPSIPHKSREIVRKSECVPARPLKLFHEPIGDMLRGIFCNVNNSWVCHLGLQWFNEAGMFSMHRWFVNYIIAIASKAAEVMEMRITV